MQTHILAIDPGKSGGMAMLWGTEASAWGMPDTAPEIVQAIHDTWAAVEADGGKLRVVVEKVGGFVGSAQPGSAMFRFGHGVGVIHGACHALQLRMEEVTPQKWQKPLGVGTKSACKDAASWKRKLKEVAQQRYPALRVTLKTADALLILDWAMGRDGAK